MSAKYRLMTILLILTSGLLVLVIVINAQSPATRSYDQAVNDNTRTLFAEGKQIFRFDTFGDEDFWGGTLRLHEPIAGAKHGGTGPGLTPKQALAVGLKVDVDQLPAAVVAQVQSGKVNFDDPETTILLLQNNAVVGVKAFADKSGKVTGMGITCAFCHSTVDDAVQPGIGHRLDGWPNRDLNVGAIVAMAPNLAPIATALGVDEPTVKKVLNSWGPGKYDAELNFDGKAFRPDGKAAATLLPPAFGLAGVNNHTWTGAWGGVTYWNAYVANTQMHGKGTFFDPRLANAEQFPLGAKNGAANLRNTPDLITPKLAALEYYQLSLPAPKPPDNSFDHQAAARGGQVFNGKAQCATCHVPPLFTEPGWNLHTAAEIGIDDFQSSRSPDKRYRTAPLRGLFAHSKGGFYHDGRFATLGDVVEHYNTNRKLGLSEQEMKDLIEYLKSL
jgi:Cytochrome c